MRIVSRAEWGALLPNAIPSRPLEQVVGVCYHHTAGIVPVRGKTGKQIVKGLQAWQMDHEYDDIAYNALIGPWGVIYEGRSLFVRGGHSSGDYKGVDANVNTLGIAFLGNYQGVHRLTRRQKRAALGLEYLWGLKVGRGLEVVAHRETKATACPGDDVMRWIEGRR